MANGLLVTFFTFLLSLSLSGQSSRLNLLFAGDIMGHDSQIKAAEVEKDKLYDYIDCFEWVAPVVRRADLAVANLELTLPGSPPYKGYPQFRSPDELALALRDAGFDLLVTANNHSNDAGRSGLINTIGTLETYGFHQTGTFRNQEDREAFYPLIVYKNGFKLAFLNYTYGTNGLPDRSPTVVNRIDLKQMEKDMETARSLRPDFIIAVMHWGKEYQREEDQEQRFVARHLIQWGADLIVGSHPHVAQPIKWEDKPGTGQQVLVAYSLGNFVSGQTKPHTDGGIMLEVELVKEEATEQTYIDNYHFLPVWRHIQRHADGSRTYRVLPVAPLESDLEAIPFLTPSDRSAMMKYTESTRLHLTSYGSLERALPFDIIKPLVSATAE